MSFEIVFNQLMQGVPYDQYAAAGGLRASHLKLMKQSPAHLRASIMSPKTETPALREGKLFHHALENGSRFMDTLKVEPEFWGKTKTTGEMSQQSKEAKLKRAEWRASLPAGTIVVTSDEAEMISGMFVAMYKHRLVGKLMAGGVRETSIFVKDPETGLILQCRPDFISERGFIVDAKTTRDASESFFLGQIFGKFGPFYILAAAHYVHVAKLAGIGRHDAFTFIAIEKVPPYGIRVYPMNHSCLEKGEEWRRYLTLKYAECLARSEWPCYPDEAVEVAPPLYMDLPPQEYE